MNLNYNFGKGRLNSLLPTKKMDDPGCSPHGSPTFFGRWYAFLTLLVMVLTGQNGMAQVGSYTFAESTETYAQIAGTTSTAVGDDGTQLAIPIGFTFKFGGVDYTTFGISTNGLMRLGSAAFSSFGGFSNGFNTTNADRPLIAPFWDDNNLDAGTIRYSSSGGVLTVNWHNSRIGGNGGTGGGNRSFIVRLYQTTNVIEIVYSSPFVTNQTVTASVGLNDLTSFLSVSPATVSTVSNSTANNAISAATMTGLAGKKLTFTPGAPLACPAGLGVNSVAVGSLPYSISGQSTCGSGNNVTASNVVAVAGSSDYYGAEDETYIFTPTISGAYTITLITATDDDAGIQLYQGCPFTSGSTVVGFVQSTTGLTRVMSPNLTAGVTYYLVVDNWISPACIGTYSLSIALPPTCGVPTGLAVSDITASTADIAWVAPVGTPASYDWEIRTTGAGGSGASGLTTSGSTTSPTVSVNDVPGLTSGTAYNLYVRTNCSGGAGSSTWASPFAFTTPKVCPSGLGAGSVAISSLPYSASGLTNSGAGDNVTGTNVACVAGSASYYGGLDKTYIFTAPVTGVYNILLTTGTDDDAGIMLYQGCPFTSGSTCVANAQSTTGLTRALTPTLTSGLTYYLVVDNFPSPAFVNSYSLIIDLPTTPPLCATNVAPANGATNIAVGTVALSWTAPTSGGTPTSYDVYLGTTSGSLTLQGNATSLTYNASAPAYSTTYYWRIVPKNTAGSATGCSESSFTTQPNPFAPYCSSVTYTSAVEPITLVNFAGINNSSSATVGGTPALQNFISVTGNITVGDTYPMTLKGNTDGEYTNYFRVFVDWNHDGDFNDAGESLDGGTILTSNGTDSVQAVSSITVPANATPGTTRMRIKKLFASSTPTSWDACTGGGFGQTEDYSLVIRLKWYADADNDGFGNPAVMIESVTNPGGYVLNNTDCNDNQVQYADVDGDGFGSTTMVACNGVLNNTDCNDNQVRYADADGDGYGTNVMVACGGATVNGDCDDANNAVHPGATEICYDGIDNNCDGTIDEGCTPIVSVIQGTQCGTTLTSISQQIYANVVAGAQGYRFRVTDTSTNQVQTIDRALRVFQLTQLGNYAFDRTYQVEVSIRYNNVWQPFYGTPCTVTTPATTTKVQTAQCGATLTAMNDVIYADNVPYATGYKFRITNTLTSAQQEIERPLRDIRMNQTAIAEFNTTYTVEVAIRNTNGLYLPYGPVCNITTPSFPTSQLQVSQCDVTITNSNTTIYADSHAGATTYRFRFVNSSLGYSYQFDRPVRSFVLNSVPGLVAGETYTVQVSIEINGVFGPYGKICTITTPGNTKTSVAASSVDFTAVAAPNPFAENFRLEVSTSSGEIIHVSVYDMLGKQVENRNVEPLAITELEVGASYPSGVYNVIVSQGSEVKTLRVIKR